MEAGQDSAYDRGVGGGVAVSAEAAGLLHGGGADGFLDGQGEDCGFEG